MKITQYVRQEKAIASADSSPIRERWLWGLRLLRDLEVMSSGKSLKHGVTDQLIAGTKAQGLKLNEREIRYRLKCARTYSTEAEIRQAAAAFQNWTALCAANFPAYEAPDGEPLADHRTDTERAHDRARALADLVDGDQASLFPLRDFEPVTTTLKELRDYTEEMAGLTARFAARDRERRAYLDSLIESADDDLSVTWHDAHSRLAEAAA